MPKTLWGVVRRGKVELVEPAEVEEGTRALVTLLPESETEFWRAVSEAGLKSIWDNSEDDVYARILEK